MRVERWYEINPDDNIEPPVKSVGYLTYDGRFFYAGIRLRGSGSEGDSGAVRRSRDQLQSVMFFGYGDDRTLDGQRRLQRADRQIFVKLSYAFQR